MRESAPTRLLSLALESIWGSRKERNSLEMEVCSDNLGIRETIVNGKTSRQD